MKLRRKLWTLILILAVSLSNLCSAAALKYGDRGNAVKEIQEYLIAQCLLNAAADGVYGSSTVAAIKDFQEALGLEVDGVCGAMTYKLLRAAAYDEIDVTTFKLGDYVPEHVEAPSVDSVSDVAEIVSYDEGVEYDESVEEGDFDVPNYKRVVRVEATAYSSSEDGMGAYTASGTLCRRGIIATDPNFIPLGTRVFIPGYGYAVAEDTGGAIVGNIIDVAFDTVGECYEWGRQYIEIYILD